MVPVKPYLVTVTPVGQAARGDGVLGTLGKEDAGVQVSIYIERVNVNEFYQKYGVEISRPAFGMCEVEDAKYFLPDYEVALVNGDVFTVVGGAFELHDAGLDSDHADFGLSQKMYPL